MSKTLKALNGSITFIGIDKDKAKKTMKATATI